MANKEESRKKKKLSVIVPVFNEAATFPEMMDRLLAKQLDAVDIEIIIVESNSSDGSREIARTYGRDPRVRLVLEDRPKGKGHAVRNGLRYAGGDIILIQDADLEYDVNDYDTLLEPLVSGREAFVLGSRYGGRGWKIREFENDRFRTLLFNAGHGFFTALVNVLFGVRLRDPFTMYKVFLRDCIDGLTFECNRFDFDHEILLKLIRKGYNPVEIPVRYTARGFDEGKKVSIMRDPWTWIWAIIKYRFAPIEIRANSDDRRWHVDD